MSYKLPIPERTRTVEQSKDIDAYDALDQQSIRKPEDSSEPKLTLEQQMQLEISKLKEQVAGLKSQLKEFEDIKNKLAETELRNSQLTEQINQTEEIKSKAEAAEEAFKLSKQEFDRLIESLSSADKQLKEDSKSFVIELSLKLLEDFRGQLIEKNTIKQSLINKFELDTYELNQAIKISKEVSAKVADLNQSEVADYLKGFTIEVNQNQLVTLVDYDGYFKQLRDILNG